MRISGETGELWSFILFLYHMRSAAEEEQRAEERRLRSLDQRLEEAVSGRRRQELQEKLAGAEAACRKRESELQAHLSRASQRLNRYLTYLEKLSWEQEYRRFEERRNSRKDAAGISSYVRVPFRGMNFYMNEDAFELDRTDASGRSNLERMKKGLAPIGKDGMYVNLHHLLQTEAGGIVELTRTVHDKNHESLHINPSTMPSGIDRRAFGILRKNYWKWRAGFEERRKQKSEGKADEA